MENYMTPQEYFDEIKERKNHITDTQLQSIYDNCLELLNKYKITGQKKGMQKLLFHLDCIEKERDIVAMGIDTFVYKDDIEFYISNVADDAVKIIDLESYEREIPDEIVNIIEKIKDKFDQLYIVFTDYTGAVERKIQHERRQKDPILFGTFQDSTSRCVIDRFYYLGDWIDEYCDLTLDKMVNKIEKVGNRNIIHTIKTPEDIEELKSQLNSYKIINDKIIVSNTANKPLFTKIKTFLNRYKK